MLLMATTSNELGSAMAGPDGPKIAQGYGMFLWAGVLLYLATAWRVWVERDRLPPDGDARDQPSGTLRANPPTRHFERKFTIHAR
jgi:hypothetical protein